MLSKDQTEVLKSPQPDATAMLLSQDEGQELNPAPTAFADNGGSNDPPVGT
jgi:hypothetical protein